MTIYWVDDILNPAGQQGANNKILVVSGADGVSSVSIASLPHPNDGAMVFSIWWKAVSATTVTVNALGASKAGSITTEWSRFYMAIPTPTGSTIDIIPANGAPDIYMAMAQLEMGVMPSDWRGVPTETAFNIVSGKVETVVETVDSVVRETATPGQYQVYVAGNNSLVTESGGQTVMQITPTAFTVNNNSATDPDDKTTMEITPTSFKVNTGTVEFNVPNESLRIDGDGASMNNLTVNEQLIAPNISQKYKGPTTINVGVGQAYPNLQSVFDMLNDKLVEEQILIAIKGDLYETTKLHGTYGSGDIVITTFDESYILYGSIDIRNCQNTITLDSSHIVHANDLTSSAIQVDNCSHFVIRNAIIHGRGSTDTGITIDGSRAEIISTSIFDISTCIIVGKCTQLACNEVSGDPMDGVYLEGAMSCITWTGHRPDGYFIDTSPCIVKCDGTNPLDLDTLPVNTGTEPSVPTVNTYTKELSATASGAYYTGSGAGWNANTSDDSNRGNHLYQGAYGSLQYAGCMWFNTSDIPQTATVKSVSLTIKRYSGAGGSSPVAVNVAYTPLNGKSGDPHTNAGQSGVLTSSIANGEIQTISTSGLLSAVSSIVSNRAGGLMFYTNESTPSGKKCSRNYARFDGVGDSVVPTLTITYEA